MSGDLPWNTDAMVSKSVKGKKKLPVAVRGSRIADETSGPWKPGHKSVTFPLVSRLPFSLDQSQVKMELTRAEISAEKVADKAEVILCLVKFT